MTSINGPYTGKSYTIPLRFIIRFVDKFTLKSHLKDYNLTDHYISKKGSPYGESTLSSCEALRHIFNYDNNLKDKFINIMGKLNFEYIFNKNILLSKIFPNYGKVSCSSGSSCGKLSVLEDPEMKDRIIAMLDYWSQFILRPIHDNLLLLLKKLPQDRTFTQDPFNSWNKGSHNEKFWSLDLKSATDRFPVILQEKLLSVIYTPSVAKAWKTLLIEREYTYNSNEYFYTVGQPMGAYTS